MSVDLFWIAILLFVAAWSGWWVWTLDAKVQSLRESLAVETSHFEDAMGQLENAWMENSRLNELEKIWRQQCGKHETESERLETELKHLRPVLVHLRLENDGLRKELAESQVEIAGLKSCLDEQLAAVSAKVETCERNHEQTITELRYSNSKLRELLAESQQTVGQLGEMLQDHLQTILLVERAVSKSKPEVAGFPPMGWNRESEAGK